MILLDPISGIFTSPGFLFVFKALYYTAFLWLPLLLLFLAWELWVRYVQSIFFAKQTYILLEIKLPKDIYKSPKAMEFFINGLYQTIGEGNWYEKYWKGQVRAWFSLEIVSIGGAIHFYVWTRAGSRNILESNLYSQFPGIEINQAEDYTLFASYDSENKSYWASEFDLTKPDAFPIKTYVDYGLDKDQEEEYKIDPITPLIEFLGSIPKGQEAWLQIVVRAHKAEEKDHTKKWSNAKIFQTFKPGDIWDRWEKKDLRWKEAAKDEVNKIIEAAKGEKGPDGKFVPGTGRQLTETERDTITAINRSVSKNGYDVGMRAVYIAPKDTFNPSNIGGIIGGITHFNSHLNGFKPSRGAAENYGFWLLVWKKRSDKKKNR